MKAFLTDVVAIWMFCVHCVCGGGIGYSSASKEEVGDILLQKGKDVIVRLYFISLTNFHSIKVAEAAGGYYVADVQYRKYPRLLKRCEDTMLGEMRLYCKDGIE